MSGAFTTIDTVSGLTNEIPVLAYDASDNHFDLLDKSTAPMTTRGLTDHNITLGTDLMITKLRFFPVPNDSLIYGVGLLLRFHAPTIRHSVGEVKVLMAQIS